jgi:hypothetical protein
VTSRERENLGYDLECRRSAHDEAVRHVEVKGTSGPGREILVSPNEVRYAREHPETAELFVVADVQVSSDRDGLPVASGGHLVHSGPWANLEHGLTPTGYAYQPATETTEHARGATAA